MLRFFLDFDLDLMISQKMVKAAKNWSCLECGHNAKRSNLIEHVESKHIVDHPGCICNLCQQNFKNRIHMRMHRCNART